MFTLSLLSYSSLPSTLGYYLTDSLSVWVYVSPRERVICRLKTSIVPRSYNTTYTTVITTCIVSHYCQYVTTSRVHNEHTSLYVTQNLKLAFWLYTESESYSHYWEHFLTIEIVYPCFGCHLAQLNDNVAIQRAHRMKQPLLEDGYYCGNHTVLFPYSHCHLSQQHHNTLCCAQCTPEERRKRKRKGKRRTSAVTIHDQTMCKCGKRAHVATWTWETTSLTRCLKYLEFRF